MDAARKPASLTSLPAEIRWQIWDAVAQTDDLNNLALVGRMIRHDVLSRVPGASYSCMCPPAVPCACEASFDVHRLSVIVDPECSKMHWLGFRVQTGQGSPVRTWCVSDLDSRFSRAVRYYRPREIVVEFQSPSLEDCEPLESARQCKRMVAILILRAKLFDVCEVLTWCRLQRERYLQIYFSDPHQTDPRVGSFWQAVFASWRSPDPVSWLHRRNLNSWNDECRPQFYESLFLPFCLHWAWRHAEVMFDENMETVQEGPSWERCFHHRHGTYIYTPSLDPKSLGLSAWAYMEALIQSGTIDRWGDTQGQGSLSPYFPQYEVNAEAWRALKGQKMIRKQRRPRKYTFHHHLCHAMYFSRFLDGILDVVSRYQPARIETLRAHILRARDSSKANAFSRLHPEGEGEWRWNFESARQAYIWWALGEANNRSWLSWRDQYEVLWPAGWPRGGQDIERRFHDVDD